MHSVAPRRVLTAAAIAALATIGLTACGSDSGSDKGTASTATRTSTTPSGGSPSALALAADPGGALRFNTTKLSAKAGTVVIAMRNPSDSGIPHAIAVEGNGVDKDGPSVQPGATSTVKVALKAGTYTFYCPVDGHRAAGMKGTLTVR